MYRLLRPLLFRLDAESAGRVSRQSAPDTCYAGGMKEYSRAQASV